ncbi:acyl-CoA dehydrogenase family protein [Pseudonocardia sp. TRM90224]|uniref:acyl-CoA dehydrogenase family protein n=1 Tax=Pseudonocardia sp. TRM90224 TaxID=2812678 RepID=UPI001E558193|nr:acyl-CoA dehydrogenase family protein [Pseudonocardia sp. TRM90224]
MDFTYTPRQRELKERAASLTKVIMEHELDNELNNGLSDEVHAQLRQAILDHGLQAINMPAEWGGAGLTVLEQAIVQEELGRLTGALWDVLWRPANALRACTPEQRERYLLPEIRGVRRDAVAVTEEHAGSDPQGLATKARKVGDKWILDGEKWFVTVGDAADFFVLLADVDGRPTTFLVDKDLPGVEVKRIPRYTHTFVYEHPEFTFTGVELGDDCRLGEVGQGYDLIRDWFVEERLMIGARTVGAAARATELAAEHANNREQFGQPISHFQLVQAMLADNVVDVVTNRNFVYQVAWEADQGIDRKALHAKAAVAKLAASEAANRAVDRALQIFGGRGYMRENPVERLWRELRVDRIWEGTSEIQRLIIGNEIAKRGVHAVLSYPGELGTA